MKISLATKNQLPIIQELAYKIWPGTYGDILSKVQLDFMLEKFYNIDYLENLLLVENQVFLLISENEVFVGFCAYQMNIPIGNPEILKTKLHKIYVLPETQGKGFGKILLHEVEKIALNNNNTAVFLNVNRYNKAQEFYKNQQYKITSEVDIEIGNGYLMEDFVMEKML